MLPLVYEDAGIAKDIAENPETAPIPELHRAMYAWVKKFVRSSWELRSEDLQPLRDQGVDDACIAQWAQIASLQSWWTMVADGGGIPLDGDMETGIAVGNNRAWYEKSEEGLLASPGSGNSSGGSRDGSGPWVATNTDTAEYRDVSAWATERYGFVPALLTATSITPSMLRRHRSALELLEGPQTAKLSATQHAMARSLASYLNRCDYTIPTTRALLETVGGEGLYEKVISDWANGDWTEADSTVLRFAAKAVQNTYKVTEKDAQSFRDVGLDDEAYVDVLNTVAIQTTIDRLANSLGFPADPAPCLPKEHTTVEAG